MKTEISRPLTPDQPRSSDDPALVEQVLGAEQAGDMRELTGDRKQDQSAQPTEIETTGDEQTATHEAEKIMAEVRHDEYVEWAARHSKDEDWVDETFVFKTDGTVIAEGGVDFDELKIDTLPPKLIEVGGDLDLRSNQITSLEGLPSTIGKDLHLFNIPATSIPEGLKIAGDIYLGVDQTALKADCEAKGYSVMTI